MIALLFSFTAANAQEKPNIVLVFMDNFGWGEPGFNGSLTSMWKSSAHHPGPH
jgi:arylsulfatase A-like enzyme